jgi:hypothetical protein
MSRAEDKPSSTAPAKRSTARHASGRYGIVEGKHPSEAPKKKNLRLHQSKIDEAKEILGTATETETIEAALDLVVFRKELVEGVRAMRGADLVNLFDDVDG